MTKELVEQARAYLDDTKTFVSTMLPTIEGLSLDLHISRDTIYEWEKLDTELGKEFSDIVDELRAAQGQKLIQNSLQGRYNPSISKLILSGKHGYVEKTEVDQNVSGNVQFINDVPRPKVSDGE
jgi:hypothetical protein